MKLDIYSKLFLEIAFLLAVSTTFAQQTTSAISGKISDSTEDLPGATVQILFTPTNTLYGVVTNHEGRYFLANLTPGGPYEITITFVGYKTKKYNDINLNSSWMLFFKVMINYFMK